MKEKPEDRFTNSDTWEIIPPKEKEKTKDSNANDSFWNRLFGKVKK